MCITCNPICGHCRPPRKRAVFCPDCDAYNIFDIVVASPPVKRSCSRCGRDITQLSIPKTVYCQNTGQLCANPCHYHTIMPDPRVVRICRTNTPPPVKEGIGKSLPGDGQALPGIGSALPSDGQAFSGRNNALPGDGQAFSGRNNALPGDGQALPCGRNALSGRGQAEAKER
ncbi:MAG: hypothetical protein LBG81_00090 [Coriobacteriaceae bacterium]|nr:hypothetical protein [Coriobacteriaceae bacterium]